LYLFIEVDHMPNGRVLFLDDDFTCNSDTCEYLRLRGFNTKSVYCAFAAIEALGRGDRLSALVTDINLGPGADGFEVARRARAAYPGLAVIYISGAERLRYASEGVEPSEFICKPFEPSQIVEALQRAAQAQAA
jgi:DNA-binding NtrC family response regulator